MKKTLLIILMILAISVVFILPQLPVQKLFDDPSESLIEADNSSEISPVSYTHLRAHET